MSEQMRKVVSAANRVKLAVTFNASTLELYGYKEPVLDTKITLRRVSLFAKGSGRVELHGEERIEAITILEDRFDSLIAQDRGY